MTDKDQNLIETLIAYVSALPSRDALVLEVLKTSMTGFALYRGPSLRLRRAYLASLEEPQEWFLEELVGSGSVWLHEDGSYAITHHDTLVEFSSASHDFGAKRLRNFHAQKGFSRALAKSFDTELVHSFRQLGWSETVGGHLFRRRKHVSRHAFEGAEMHVAQPEDLEAIWRINDKFFSDEAEVADLTASKKTLDGEGKRDRSRMRRCESDSQ